MNILLLGANGQLGRTFLQDGRLAKLGTLVAASRDGHLTDGGHGESVDLADAASLTAALDRIHPAIIVNTAAYTAVDRAEQEEALATRINGEAVGDLGRWAAANHALVVHYSTDYVFDGSQQQPYSPQAPTAPLGAYGRSKLVGEQALQASGADHLLFRTAWVYAAHGQNFLRTMLRLGAEREELRVVADQHGAPTSTDIIVDGSVAALERWLQASTTERSRLQGIHHLVASGNTTWHGFAETIFDEAQRRGLIARKPRVLAIDTAAYPTPAQRPAWSILDNSEFAARFGVPLIDWRQGLYNVMAHLSA